MGRKKEIRLESATSQLRDYFGTFFDLTNERIMAATRHGVSNAVNALIKQTESNIYSSWFNESLGKTYSTPLSAGVRGYLYIGEATGIVTILGDTRHDDGTWRLRFFEGGTKLRKSKHGKDYGQIRPAYFFASASDSVNYFDIIKNSVERAVDEINN